ncbi:heterokaryon incompatibility protein-domain-containing protein, partial [Dendryphion nanum]
MNSTIPDSTPQMRYPHLPSTPFSIRLLQFSLLPTGNFRGHLTSFPLAHAPPFHTASYAWGPQTYSRTMVFENGDVLPILDNVSSMLEMVARDAKWNERDWWWIDSVCIDLGNWSERVLQVSIMELIYKRAGTECVVWLGEEEGECGRDGEREEGASCRGAVEFLHLLKDLRDSLAREEVLREKLRGDVFKARWQAVARFLQRSWWTRVWTLQEFLLSPTLTFHCGRSSISSPHLSIALYSIYLITNGHDNMLIPRSSFDAAWNRRRIQKLLAKREETKLVATLAYMGNHFSTDARDRIHSIRGIVGKRDEKVVEFVLDRRNYVDSRGDRVEEMYAQLVQAFWINHTSLDIICFTHLFNASNSSLSHNNFSTLPSWAPEWRAYLQVSPVPLMASQSASPRIGNFMPPGQAKRGDAGRGKQCEYNASAGSQLRKRIRVRFHENLKEMWVDGVVLGCIDGLAGLEGFETRCRSLDCGEGEFGHAVVYPTSGRGKGKERNMSISEYQSELLDAVVKSLVLDRKDKYLDSAAPGRFTREFLALCVSAERDGDAEVDKVFTAWWTSNAELTIDITNLTLRALVQFTLMKQPQIVFSEPLPPPPRTPVSASPKSAPPPDSHTFLSRFHDTVRKQSRRLMVTENGIVGMAPCRARQGDFVVILFGCKIPLVLRRVGTREAWKVLGEAYVHGFMNGEVGRSVEGGEREISRFRLV